MKKTTTIIKDKIRMLKAEISGLNKAIKIRENKGLSVVKMSLKVRRLENKMAEHETFLSLLES